MVNPCTRFVNNVIYVVVCVLGVYLVIKGSVVPGMSTLSVGALSCVLSYATQYTKPFNEITGVVTELQGATAAASRVFDLLEAQNQSSDAGFEELTDAHGNIDIDDVYFSYVKDKPLIQGFSLNVKSGQRVAIVGPTGCGKTTLINLLMRFYDPDSGKIEVEGKDISEVTRKSLRLSYGMVLQDTWLKKGTVRENIAYGNPDATEEEIIEAAKAAHIHNFIMHLENGYDTVLDDDGGNISQGQKQLLCIARVMLTHPPMLILDEATSSIDTRTEIKIQQAFEQDVVYRRPPPLDNQKCGRDSRHEQGQRHRKRYARTTACKRRFLCKSLQLAIRTLKDCSEKTRIKTKLTKTISMQKIRRKVGFFRFIVSKRNARFTRRLFCVMISPVE